MITFFKLLLINSEDMYEIFRLYIIVNILYNIYNNMNRIICVAELCTKIQFLLLLERINRLE